MALRLGGASWKGCGSNDRPGSRASPRLKAADLLHLRAPGPHAAPPKPRLFPCRRPGRVRDGPASPRPVLRARARRCLPRRRVNPAVPHTLHAFRILECRTWNGSRDKYGFDSREARQPDARHPRTDPPGTSPRTCPLPPCMLCRLLLAFHGPIPVSLARLYRRSRFLPTWIFPSHRACSSGTPGPSGG